MKKFYNKLVRDNIPKIIMSNGSTNVEWKALNDEEFLECLNTKLQEELKEYLESGDIEELADLEEVLRAILNVKKITYDEFEKIRITKTQKRGGFYKKIFLESVEEDNQMSK